MDTYIPDYLSETSSATDCVEAHTDRFYEHVMLDIDYWHRSNVHGIHAPFAQFKLADEDFHLYVHATNALESITRTDLINPSLADLFSIRGISALWPDLKETRHQGTNASYELDVPYEFIVNEADKKTAYRYTNPIGSFEDIQYEIDELVILEWREASAGYRRCESDGDFPLRWERSDEFFEQYFCKEDYKNFVTAVHKAISTAQELFRFSTVPKLSTRYLAQFKEDLAKEIAATSGCRLEYKQGPERKERTLSIGQKDYKAISKRFYERELYRALIGEASFAKCFITAEYMYKNFDQGGEIDYTVIAAGYLKAVEQLEHHLVKLRLKRPTPEKLWIKSELFKKDTAIAP